MLQEKVKIQSLDDLLAFMGQVHRQGATWDDVDMDTLSVIIPVVVEGDTWDGKIDVRGAKLIQDLQRRASIEYRNSTGVNLTQASLVKATPSDGSNILDIDFTELLKTVATNMTPEQSFYFLCIAVLGTLGTAIYYRYASKCEDTRKMAAINNAVNGMKEIASQALENGYDVAQPIRRYANRLKKDDQLSVAGSELMPKKVAIEKLARPVVKEDTTLFTHCDGDYILTGLDIYEELPVLYLMQGEAKADAFFFNRVPPKVRELIIKTVENSLATQTREMMPLHMDVYFTGSKIQRCVILGIGAPREELTHYELVDVPDNVDGRDKKVPGLD
jgi:hypothetical protein